MTWSRICDTEGVGSPRSRAPADFDALARAYRENGFRSSCAWYLNGDANTAYARAAPDGGRLAGHWLPLECKTQLIEIIRDWLRA